MNLANFASFHSPIGKALRLPLRLIPREATVPVLGGPLRGARWIVGSSNHGCWLGTYEKEMQKLFWKMLPQGGVVWDIGAHVGFYSLMAARKARAVVAIEPDPRNLRYLYRHLELNCVTNMEVIAGAAADREGCENFAPSATHSQGRLRANGSLPVRTLTIDSAATAPDLIKIDVEGEELRVLLGARETLHSKSPVLFLSMHSDPRECWELLSSFGYQMTAVDGGTALATRA
jgi:FkbM family methyltransferase